MKVGVEPGSDTELPNGERGGADAEFSASMLVPPASSSETLQPLSHVTESKGVEPNSGGSMLRLRPQKIKRQDSKWSTMQAAVGRQERSRWDAFKKREVAGGGGGGWKDFYERTHPAPGESVTARWGARSARIADCCRNSLFARAVRHSKRSCVTWIARRHLENTWYAAAGFGGLALFWGVASYLLASGDEFGRPFVKDNGDLLLGDNNDSWEAAWVIWTYIADPVRPKRRETRGVFSMVVYSVYRTVLDTS